MSLTLALLIAALMTICWLAGREDGREEILQAIADQEQRSDE
jgi:hypothetical protein